MRSHTALWIDEKGKLCEEPPNTGIKIASRKGAEIPSHFVKKYKLIEESGEVKQAKRPYNKMRKLEQDKGGLAIRTKNVSYSSKRKKNGDVN